MHENAIDPKKKAYHTKAKKILKEIASRLGKTKDDYDLRTDYAGPAVRGETTLHCNDVYIQIGSEFGSEVLIRSCKSRKDYTGGRNHFVSTMDYPDEVYRIAKQCMENYI